MRYDDLKDSISQAHLFLEKADKIIIKNNQVEDYTKESAALRRQSMELTRSLARLRHPYRDR